MGQPKYPITFEGPSTQNLTFAISNLTSVGTGYIPVYTDGAMHMTEGIGTGIIMSIVTAQLAQQYLQKTVGKGCTWATTCAINSFVYTITVVMMGTSSAIFNSAVLFGWAILGRTSWEHWILLSLSQLLGGLAGCLCAWSQFIVNLNRVPIPFKDEKGQFLYVQVPFAWGKYWRYRHDPARDWLAEARSRRAVFRGSRAVFGAGLWSGLEYSPDDAIIHADELPQADSARSDSKPVDKMELGSSEAGGATSGVQAHPGKRLTELSISDPEYQAELARDRKNKLIVFAETPLTYSPLFYASWWPHFMAGTTLCHWLSFMTGNASQLTNNNMYLTQPVNGTPGSVYGFVNGVMLAWLVGLAYFLLTASAGGICTLQLNPIADLAGRILHTILPIPNKGYSGWSYAPVPLLLPYLGALFGCGLMYMSMWSHLYFPFRPYGSMPQWF